MNYRIVVPEPVEREIESWELSFGAGIELYSVLDEGVSEKRLSELWRLPGPGFTYVWPVEFRDPVVPGINHSFTFWLVHGADDDALEIHQVDHVEEDDWSSSQEDENDDRRA